jgi:hypothetical protein
MKKIRLIIVSLLLFFSAHSQTQRCGTYSNIVNFEDTAKIHRCIRLDTNSVNIWTIGKPTKSKFDSAYSRINAIMTKTTEFYPPNTNSSFLIALLRDIKWSSGYCDSLYVKGYFKVDSDSINDYGKIEISHFIDHDWFDLSTYSDCYIDGVKKKPLFTGNLSDKWHEFSFSFNPNILDYPNHNDSTLWLRFTFISDSIDTHKEGWIIDDISINNSTPGGINDNVYNNFIIISPNPVPRNGNFTISINKIEPVLIKIYDSQGKLHNLIYKPTTILTLNSNQFQKGIYLIETFDKKGMMYINKLLVD